MGKKTNWTVSEDQTLCRAWLDANEAVLPQSSDQKAATFWNAVHQLFHTEIQTSVERPLNGLKIRWTRINRDVQKFALTYAQVQTAALASVKPHADTADGGGDVPAALDAAHEQQCIEDAKEQFYKEQDTKFLFEACWKLLRYSPKWIQLLANSAGMPASTSSMNSHFLGVDSLPRIEDNASHVSGGTDHVTTGFQPNNKRRVTALLESYGRAPFDQLYSITSTLAEEMKRRNELLEEQNAIALFRLETDMIEDDDARECFELLRRKYIKKLRTLVASPVITNAATMVTTTPAGANNEGSQNTTEGSEEHVTVESADAEKNVMETDLVV